MSPGFLSGQQTTIRFAVIGVIVLAMLIPLAMVEGVTEERQSFFDATLGDIARSWGSEQDVAGPFLVVPEAYRYQVKTDQGELVWRTTETERVYLPSTLNLDAEVAHQYRRRSIYEVPVYSANLGFSGSFAALDARPADEQREVRLDRARLVVGISHTQAISNASTATVGDREIAFGPGTDQTWVGTGIHVPLDDYRGKAMNFSFDLAVKGTSKLGFTPVGGTTRVSVDSTWPHPSFNGTYLPERYDINADGFSAQWVVHELARDLPGSWRTDQQAVNLGDSFAWVSLFQPVTEYTIVDRAIKYGLLFIALTFLGFLCFELTSGLKFHPVQYGVVGIGLVLFYLALLSLSEHIPFGVSYLVATVLLTVLIGWYVWAMTAERTLTAWMVVILAALYGTLYVLLQLEAFALLVGTAALFVGLIALMVTTRSLTGRAVEPA